eukprot:64054-Ditylum_brightwellii.AAC.1
MEDIKTYWQMIGKMQWAVALGQIEIIAATVIMVRFRPAPCQGHLKRLKHKCQTIPTTMLRRRIGDTFIISVKRRFQRICPSPMESLSCTGIIHLLNKTPIGLFSERQNTVETVTYGSEFVAARTA